MENIIRRYVNNENQNGLLLIDMPTGSGKTYSAVKFIYEECLKPENKDRKYIFVTTLKKNLPYRDLLERFEKDGKKEQYQEKVLVIESNIDSVVNGWSSEVDNEIPVELKRCDEYKEFQRDVNFVKKQRKDKAPIMREYLTSIEANLREKTEPRFRRVIIEYLNKEYMTVQQKLYAIRTKEKWKWIGVLYPAVFTKDRQVLFLSMDKFLSRNTTIVEPSYMFYNSDVIKNAVIFIDEFDATKDTILKKIIENGLHDKIDYVELFKDIYASLHTDDFPTVLTTSSNERTNSKWSSQTLESVVEGIREKADYIHRTYSLQYKHKTQENMADNYQNYLFQDHQFHSILSADNSYITMHSDIQQKINRIGFTQKKPETKSENIQTMLGKLRGFIGYFQGAVYILAINYMQCEKERRKDGEDDFSMESAIRSVLALFRLNDDSIDFLTGQIMMSPRKIRGAIEPADFDLSFYERGFRYYAFENNTEHDMQSQIMMYAFQTTPEKILLKFCEKAKVIGISATATIPSVVGNYDIDYLKHKMQKIYTEVSGEEKERLKAVFHNQQRGYENIEIHAELLGVNEIYGKNSWRSVFDTEELAALTYDKIQRLFGEDEDKNDYNKKRYLRIALAFKQFVIHEDIYSFLCVLNKHPKTNDKYLKREILFSIFENIAKENEWGNYNNQKTIVFLDGAEYDEKKNNLVERLGNGEKLFVISVYQTIGAGQNLQYPVPDSLKDQIVKINNRVSKDEKDFDAIYLDKPTNLIVPLNDNIEATEFVKYLFQMEFLQESAEISSYDTMRNIKKAFRTFMTGRRNNTDGYANVYVKKSVVLLSTRYLIQAIGRICRTNQKSRHIYVYADGNIADCVDTSIVNGRIYNPEFIALVDKINQTGAKDPQTMSLENSASLTAVRVNKEILNILQDEWTEAIMKRWKALRDLTLCHPTASIEEAEKNFIIRNFYVRLPKAANGYYYSQEEDYNSVSVAFSQDREHSLIVSEKGTKLQKLLRIPGVKKLFESNGWATEFKVNDYIMAPPLWNNIYKGALGEVVGKYLLEKNLGVEVKEIENPEFFELFDFEIAESPVYVDFKNWQEGITEEKTEVIEKISRKAKKCGCKRVVVANIYAEGKWEISELDSKGVHIVSLPCLVRMDNEGLSYDKAAWNTLRRCVSEYKNQDESD